MYLIFTLVEFYVNNKKDWNIVKRKTQPKLEACLFQSSQVEITKVQCFILATFGGVVVGERKR